MLRPKPEGIAALKDNKGILTGPMPSASNELDDMLLRTMNNGWRHKAAGLLCCCLLFVAALRCEAQGNLIPNPSFEEADTCAVQAGFLPNGKPLHWACCETPDYFRACVPYGSVNGIPVNFFGFQFLFDGESYVGMYAHALSDYREIIAAELLEPLVVGQTYYGSFWVNAAYGGPDWTGLACNNMGMLMRTSMDIASWQPNSSCPGSNNFAHVYSNEVIADTAGWTLVSGSFVADSTYRYVVVGNHFSNGLTTVQVLGPGDPNEAYVYVDALCLSSNPVGCPMATSIHEGNAGEIGLWPNPASTSLRVGWGRWPVRTVAVMDSTGRRLSEHRVGGSSELVIPVNHLPNGIYHLLLEGEGGKHTRKFVVMR